MYLHYETDTPSPFFFFFFFFFGFLHTREQRPFHTVPQRQMINPRVLTRKGTDLGRGFFFVLPCNSASVRITVAGTEGRTRGVVCMSDISSEFTAVLFFPHSLPHLSTL